MCAWWSPSSGGTYAWTFPLATRQSTCSRGFQPKLSPGNCSASLSLMSNWCLGQRIYKGLQSGGSLVLPLLFFIQWNYFYHEEPFLVDLDKLLIPLIGDLFPVLHPPRPPFAMAISVATCFSKRYSAAPLLIECICIYFGHICISFSASPQPSLLPRGGGYICLTHRRHLEVWRSPPPPTGKLGPSRGARW